MPEEQNIAASASSSSDVAAAAGAAPAMELPIASRLADAVSWLKARERAILIAAVAFQVLVLVAMMVRPAATLATGKTIRVQVVPVDPRDLFRGDYVILGYDFSRYNANLVDGMTVDEATKAFDEREGQAIYATLVPGADGVHYELQSLSFTPPTSGLTVAGTLKHYGRIEYGIEAFYVQEGRGKAYEDAVREHKLAAEVAIDPSGNAVVKELVIEP